MKISGVRENTKDGSGVWGMVHLEVEDKDDFEKIDQELKTMVARLAEINATHLVSVPIKAKSTPHNQHLAIFYRGDKPDRLEG